MHVYNLILVVLSLEIQFASPTLIASVHESDEFDLKSRSEAEYCVRVARGKNLLIGCWRVGGRIGPRKLLESKCSEIILDDS